MVTVLDGTHTCMHKHTHKCISTIYMLYKGPGTNYWEMCHVTQILKVA